jgi:hypothetical protein
LDIGLMHSSIIDEDPIIIFSSSMTGGNQDH